jgi:multimeric flavodoxin WrbA
MRAIVICGSADEGGVTRRMCDSAADVLRSKGYGVDEFQPSEMDIGHCRDCGSCDSNGCILNDDMSEIYDSFSQADLLILSTPIHFSGPSSIIKTVMDRFQPYWGNNGLNHPDYCMAMMCGGSKQPNFEMTERIIRMFCITTGMEYRGSLQIPDTDSGVPDVRERVERFLSLL